MKIPALAGLVLWQGAILFGADALPRSAPERQGISSTALLEFLDGADSKIDGMHSLILVRHGHVVAEGWWAPYDAETRHELYSLSKSFTSTAVGLAISEGKLGIDDEVGKFFPEDMPETPKGLVKSMRVRDLLCMSTGHQTEPQFNSSDQPWTKTFLAHDVPHKPGAHFLYNTPATYMQSAIVQKVTGMTVLDYLRPRLFDPLGIKDPSWGTSPQGITLGGYGLSVRTEDIARFGQLYLRKGDWNGRQLVPAEWIAAATARQTSNGSNPKSDWDQGYGYQFWRCRNGCYRGDGAFGQYCIVMPEQDAVVAITSGVKDMQAVLNLIWDKLLPAFQNVPLAENAVAHDLLKKRLAQLEISSPKGESTTDFAQSVWGRSFAFPANPAGIDDLRLERGEGNAAHLVISRREGGDQRIACGHGAWVKGRARLGPAPERPMLARGAWTGENVYAARLCFHETPFCTNVKLEFVEGGVSLDIETNVGFGNTKIPPLVGKPTSATGK
jgi:CubicO group peptidase (beta-lactamase class C family)